ncbi:MAG TPA: MFS transporter [Blastocatellia bacterium]|nr:MFS transporter [Blastocatellia bacterium]
MSQNILAAEAVDEKTRLAQTIAIATGFLCLFSLVGLSFYGLPSFYGFWEKEFGWTRARATSGILFGKILVGPLFGFIAGYIIDRFGPRRLMLSGILMGGVSLIGLSQMTSLWMFYLFFLFNALGYVCGGPLPNQVLLSRWFDKARGKAMGMAYLGIGIGGAVVPLLAAWLITNYNWRQALLIIGILMILIAFPMAWFVKEAPENFDAQKRSAEPPIPIREILRKGAFYLLAIGSMCSIGAVSGTIQHLQLYLRGQGYTLQGAARISAYVLAASIGGRLLMGWLADKMPKKYVMILIYVIVASAIPLLYFIHTPGVIYAFAFLFGIGLGGDYMIIPLMAAELFGVRVMGRVMGIILTADGLAEAFAPLLVGRLYDLNQNYVSGFGALILLAAIGAVAVALLPRKSVTP